METLESAAQGLAVAVDGIDWDVPGVQRGIRAIHRLGKQATSTDLDAALGILVERLERFSVEDADGAAHVAMTGGALVEFGASATPLGEVLLKKLPPVLRAARECADACLADPRTPSDALDDDESEMLTEVDQRPILLNIFREHLETDRRRAALAYLREWTLSAVAAWTRSRDCLVRATRDPDLVNLAEGMAASEAHWLRTLLGAQLEASWLVLCPLQQRGFRVLLDGIVSNQDFHVQLAAALVPRGIEGTACSGDVVAYLEGRGPQPDQKWVRGTWNLYDYRVATRDLKNGDRVPTKFWVWAEGIPNDIPRMNGEPILIVGPESVRRSWTLQRVFCALPGRITVTEELDADAFEAQMTRARHASP